jgi:hypothetical protein
VDKHSGGISKGAEASPQPKQTNKQTNSNIPTKQPAKNHQDKLKEDITNSGRSET